MKNMKLSLKIILALASLVLVLFTTGLLVFHTTLKTLGLQGITYTEIPVERFEALDFSSHWYVHIEQGKEFKVALPTHGKSPQPVVVHQNGTLCFHFGTQKPTWGSHVKIVTPDIRMIKARGNTKITLERFRSDTLRVFLEDSSTFKADSSYFQRILVEQSGEALYSFTQTKSSKTTP